MDGSACAFAHAPSAAVNGACVLSGLLGRMMAESSAFTFDS